MQAFRLFRGIRAVGLLFDLLQHLFRVRFRHGPVAFAEHRGGHILIVLVLFHGGHVKGLFRAVRQVHDYDDFRGLERVQADTHVFPGVQAVIGQFPQVVFPDAIMRMGINGDDKVGPHVPAFVLPESQSFQNVTRYDAQLFFRNGQPGGVACHAGAGMFHSCTKVTPPAVRLVLQIRNVRHVHKTQTAFKLALDKVLALFHRARGVGRTGAVMDDADTQLLAKARHQRRRVGGTRVRIKDKRQAMRRVVVPPVVHEVDQGAQDALGTFTRRLLVPLVKDAGRMVDDDITHDALVFDFNKVGRFLGIEHAFIHDADALCPVYAVQDADRGVQLPHMVGMQGTDAPGGPALFELIRVAAVLPHGPADGFD